MIPILICPHDKGWFHSPKYEPNARDWHNLQFMSAFIFNINVLNRTWLNFSPAILPSQFEYILKGPQYILKSPQDPQVHILERKLNYEDP